VNYRLFLLHGESKYYDVLERTLYNSLLSGVSLSGDRFFYPNPLESSGEHQRSEWFGCACCPSNISRFIPAFPGYIYAKTDDEIFVNLFVDNTATIDMNGKTIEIKQATRYPWEGKIEISLKLSETSKFKLKLRRPGWSANEVIPGDLYQYIDHNKAEASVRLNGESVECEISDGYLVINRKWRAGDKTEERSKNQELRELTLIPYHLWSNRGPGEMMVWLPVR